MFSLITPTNDILSAKLCQQNSKALMTNPNKALSKWLLRQVFNLKEGELLTRCKEMLLGIDSVIIYKKKANYYIDVKPIGSYERFINNASLTTL